MRSSTTFLRHERNEFEIATRDFCRGVSLKSSQLVVFSKQKLGFLVNKRRRAECSVTFIDFLIKICYSFSSLSWDESFRKEEKYRGRERDKDEGNLLGRCRSKILGLRCKIEFHKFTENFRRASSSLIQMFLCLSNKQIGSSERAACLSSTQSLQPKPHLNFQYKVLNLLQTCNASIGFLFMESTNSSSGCSSHLLKIRKLKATLS